MNAEHTDTDRLDWLERNPRLAQIVIDGKAMDCYLYAVSGATGVPLRAIIDAAIDAAQPRDEPDGARGRNAS